MYYKLELYRKIALFQNNFIKNSTNYLYRYNNITNQPNSLFTFFSTFKLFTTYFTVYRIESVSMFFEIFHFYRSYRLHQVNYMFLGNDVNGVSIIRFWLILRFDFHYFPTTPSDFILVYVNVKPVQFQDQFEHAFCE